MAVSSTSRSSSISRRFGWTRDRVALPSPTRGEGRATPDLDISRPRRTVSRTSRSRSSRRVTVIVDRHPEAMLAMHRRVRKGGDAFFLQPQHDLGVERLLSLARRLVAAVAKTDDVDARWRDEFQQRLGLDQRAEIMSLRDVFGRSGGRTSRCRAPSAPSIPSAPGNRVTSAGRNHAASVRRRGRAASIPDIPA